MWDSQKKGELVLGQRAEDALIQTQKASEHTTPFEESQVSRRRDRGPRIDLPVHQTCEETAWMTKSLAEWHHADGRV